MKKSRQSTKNASETRRDMKRLLAATCRRGLIERLEPRHYCASDVDLIGTGLALDARSTEVAWSGEAHLRIDIGNLGSAGSPSTFDVKLFLVDQQAPSAAIPLVAYEGFSVPAPGMSASFSIAAPLPFENPFGPGTAVDLIARIDGSDAIPELRETNNEIRLALDVQPPQLGVQDIDFRPLTAPVQFSAVADGMGGAAASNDVVIVNLASSSPLVIADGGIRIEGGDGAFKIIDVHSDRQRSIVDLDAQSHWVAAGEREHVVTRIEFDPSVEGEFRGRLVLTTNDPDHKHVEIELVGHGVSAPPADTLGAAAQLFTALERARSGQLSVEELQSLAVALAKSGASSAVTSALDYVDDLIAKLQQGERPSADDFAELTRRFLDAARLPTKWSDSVGATTALVAAIISGADVPVADVRSLAIRVSEAAGASPRIADAIVAAAQFAWSTRAGSSPTADDLSRLAADLSAAAGANPALAEAGALATRMAAQLGDRRGITAAELENLARQTAVATGAEPIAVDLMIQVVGIAWRRTVGVQPTAQEFAAVGRGIVLAAGTPSSLLSAYDLTTALVTSVATGGTVTANEVQQAAFLIGRAAGVEERMSQALAVAAEFVWARRDGQAPTTDELAQLSRTIAEAAGGKPALMEAAAFATRLANQIREGGGVNARELEELVLKTAAASGASTTVTDAIEQATGIVWRLRGGVTPTSQELAALGRAITLASGVNPPLAQAIDAATELATTVTGGGTITATAVQNASFLIGQAAGADKTLARAIAQAAEFVWARHGGQSPSFAELAQLAAAIAEASGGKPELVASAALAAKLADQVRDGRGVSAGDLAELVRTTATAAGASAAVTDAIEHAAGIAWRLRGGTQPTALELAALGRAIAIAADSKPSLAQAIDATTALVATIASGKTVTGSNVLQTALLIGQAAGAEQPLARAIAQAAEFVWARRGGTSPTSADLAHLAAVLAEAAGQKPALVDAAVFAAKLVAQVHDGVGVTAEDLEDLAGQAASAMGASVAMTDAISQAAGISWRLGVGIQPTSQELVALGRAIAFAADAKPSLVQAFEAAAALATTIATGGKVDANDVQQTVLLIGQAADAAEPLAQAILKASELVWNARGGQSISAAELSQLAAAITEAAGGKQSLVDAAAFATRLASQIRNGAGVSSTELEELARQTASAAGASVAMTDAIGRAAGIVWRLRDGVQPTSHELAALGRAIVVAADTKPSLARAINAAATLATSLATGGHVNAFDVQQTALLIGQAGGADETLALAIAKAAELFWKGRGGQSPSPEELTQLAAAITDAAGGTPALVDAAALAARLATQVRNGGGATSGDLEELVRKTAAATGASPAMTDAIVQSVGVVWRLQGGVQPTPQEMRALSRMIAVAASTKPLLAHAVGSTTALVTSIYTGQKVASIDVHRTTLLISQAAGADESLSRAIAKAAEFVWAHRGGQAPTAGDLAQLAATIAEASGGKPALVEAIALAARLADKIRDIGGVSAGELEELARKMATASGANMAMTDAIIQGAGIAWRLRGGVQPTPQEIGSLGRAIAIAADVKPSLATAIGASLDVLVRLPSQGVSAIDMQALVHSVTAATGAEPTVVALVDQSLVLAQRLMAGVKPTLNDLTSLGQSVFNVLGMADAGQVFTTTASILQQLATTGTGPSLSQLQSLTQFTLNVLNLPTAAEIVGKLKVENLGSLLTSGLNIAASLWGRDIFTVDLGPIRLDVAALALDFACAPLGIPCGSIAQLIFGLFSKKDKNSTPQHIEFSAREEYTARLAKAVWVATIYDRIADPAVRARFEATVLSQIDEGIRLAQERHPDGDKLYHAQNALVALLRDHPELLPPADWLPFVSHNEDHLWDTDRETYSRMAADYPIFSASIAFYHQHYVAETAPDAFDLYSRIVGQHTSEGWPAYNYVYAMLQPLTVLGAPQTVAEHPSVLGGLTQHQFQLLVASLAEASNASPGLSVNFSAALGAGLSAPSTLFDRDRFVDLTNRALLRMSPDDSGVVYSAIEGRYSVGEWLFDGRYDQTRSLSFLASIQLIVGHLRDDERRQFGDIIWRLLGAIPDANLTVSADGVDPRVELIDDIFSGLAQPDALSQQAATLAKIVSSPNVASLFTALDYAGVAVLLGASPAPPPDEIVGFSASPAEVAPPPVTLERTYTRLDTSARYGATCDDVYGNVVIVGGCVTGPSPYSGGQIDFPVDFADRRYALASADGLLDTGGGFLAGHFWGKGMKRGNDTAQIAFSMNDVPLHLPTFAATRGMYNEFWALSPSESYYRFSATPAESAITGPFTFSVRADLGSAVDIRSLKTRLEFAPATFHGPLSEPLPEGPVVRHTFNARPQFQWTDIANAEDFQVLVQNNWTGEIEAQADGLRQPSFQVNSPLAPGGHWVFVRGRNSDGNGPWSRVYVVIESAESEAVPDTGDSSAARFAPEPNSVGPIPPEYAPSVVIRLSGPETGAEGDSSTYQVSLESPHYVDPSVSWRVFLGDCIAADGQGDTIPVTFTDDGDWRIEAFAIVGDEVVATTTLTTSVTNIAPSAAVTGSSNTDEGRVVRFTAVAHDPAVDDVLSYSWLVTRNGVENSRAVGATLDFDPDDDGVYLINLTVADDDGGESVATATLSVRNVAPTLSLQAPNLSASEGSSVSFAAIVADPGRADQSEISWRVVRGGRTFAQGAGASYVFTPDDDGSYVVEAIATDDDGGVSSVASSTVVVTNVAPTVSAFAPSRAVRGQALFFDAGGQDPSPIDMADLVFDIDFGDGAKYQSRGPGAPRWEHVYAQEGLFTYTVIVTDKQGARSEPAKGQVRVGLVDTDGSILRIGGGLGRDDIRLQAADTLGAIRVQLNGVAYNVAKGIQSVEVFGQAGDDQVLVLAAPVGRATVLFAPTVTVIAGLGNDFIDLRGSVAARNIISGGAGNDVIYGANSTIGGDLLIGGLGVDLLFGGLGDDFLFGDSLDVEERIDNLKTGLDDLRATSAAVWNTRQTAADLVKRGGQFDIGWTKVLDETLIDYLDGGDGTDWQLDLSLSRVRLKKS